MWRRSLKAAEGRIEVTEEQDESRTHTADVQYGRAERELGFLTEILAGPESEQVKYTDKGIIHLNLHLDRPLRGPDNIHKRRPTCRPIRMKPCISVVTKESDMYPDRK